LLQSQFTKRQVVYKYILTVNFGRRKKYQYLEGGGSLAKPILRLLFLLAYSIFIHEFFIVVSWHYTIDVRLCGQWEWMGHLYFLLNFLCLLLFTCLQSSTFDRYCNVMLPSSFFVSCKYIKYKYETTTSIHALVHYQARANRCCGARHFENVSCSRLWMDRQPLRQQSIIHLIDIL